MHTDFDEKTKAVLGSYGFDQVPFAALAKRLEERGFDPDDARLKGEVRLPDPGLLDVYPDPGSRDHERFAALGRRAIDAGEVGAVVLNGGMATRFGGVVKGVVEAVRGRSFLALKIAQIRIASGDRAPVLLMNSFSTARDTADHLLSLGLEGRVRCFSQFVSVRLTPKGEVFRDDGDAPSLHAPGHGDFSYAIARSGELARFVAGGGRWLTLSNVDNLGASLDPVIVGMHIARGNPMSVELVETHPGDVGGFPAVAGGRVAIVEAFRLPRTFDASTIPVFNTNTFVFDAGLLARHPDLDWFGVLKRVDGRDAIQFERLVGQLSEHAAVTWLKVPRDGSASRFLPIKLPADLEASAAQLESALVAQGALDA
jgi:UTP--glucose-1-phosphate uridylyltransferase